MSVNNRKYITSTGILLKQLNEESNNSSNNNSYHHHHNQQQQQQQQQQQRHGPMYQSQQQQSSGNNYHPQHNLNQTNFSNQSTYSNIPSYSTGQNMPNMFNGLFPNGPNGLPVSAALNAAAAALISKLSANPNQFQPQSNVPDIMMLPGSMSQQRWQQKTKIPSSHPYQQQKTNKNQSYQQQTKPSVTSQFQQKPVKNQTSNKKSNSSLASSSSVMSVTGASSSSSSSSVTELPETFGLPSNKVAKTTKYSSSSSTSLQSNSSASLNNNDKASTQQTEILVEDKLIEPLVNNELNSKSDDIEIIGENYPSSDTYNTTITNSTTISNNNVNNSAMMIQTAFQANNDENFKNYLAKNYNNSGQLAIATKPQSNFMSNFACINQILSECDYYNKLKRRKPYSNVRPNKILYKEEEEDDEEDNSDQGEGEETKIKSKKIIIIDDTNEEMHKPWITPDLVKLIKHRNLLQSKINENNIKLDVDSNTSAADAELLKKFKNLRNKVTKLVKKARKDYLTKYIQESKENKISTENKQSNSELDSELINNLAKNPVPPPQTTPNPNASSSAAKSPNNNNNSTIVSETTTAKSTTTLNSSVQALTSQMNSNKGSFLQNQNNLLMSLYNTYFNQYLQQYQLQQQQAQQLASETTKDDATSSTKETSSESSGYDMLQKQAAYYAQQQRAIQTQLEASLAQSAQQLVQEIAAMASTKVNQQPSFVINQQFNHQQQQHHLHQHLIQQPQQVQQQTGNFSKQMQQQTQNQMGILLPQQNQGNTPVGLLASSQSSNIYNMHYDYNNMIVS